MSVRVQCGKAALPARGLSARNDDTPAQRACPVDPPKVRSTFGGSQRAAGSSTVNVEPVPSSESTLMRPFMWRTSSREM